MADSMSKIFREKQAEINDIDSLVEIVGGVMAKYAEERASGTAYDTDTREEQENFARHVNPAFLKAMFADVIVKQAKGYEEENEWVVDSNVLNIPASSTIYIAGPETKNKKR